MKKKLLVTLAMLSVCWAVNAQEWMKVHRSYDGESWTFPLEIDKMSQFEFSDDETELRGYALDKEGGEMIVPFDVEGLDSISFANDLADEEKGHDKYRVFTLYITTENGREIKDKEEWINCHFSLDGKGEYSDYSGTGRIKGRGNSSWLFYDKKPYKFKLDEKHKLLGMGKAKNWNLLSNYRDVTDMMNMFAFETARWMGLPHTVNSRFVEMFLNGDYVGVYQLTEKVEIGEKRVNIDKEEGVLMSFDKDDGPELSPDAADNFWSEVYDLPMCVKEPEDIPVEKLDSIKADFAVLERAVKAKDYAVVDSLMDIPSFIAILQLHEFLYNVEIDAPRSLYMYKDKGGKYVFGPVWDWDAAYDFDWADWTENHTYFSSYKELIYGRDPLNAGGANYSINKFFRDMFGSKEFVAQYKQAWEDVSDSIYTRNWAEIHKYIDEMNKGAYERDVKRWPLKYPYRGGNYDVQEEIGKMAKWLKNRKDYLDGVIADYPDADEQEEEATIAEPVVTTKDGAVYVRAEMDFYGGYNQEYKIKIDKTAVQELLGGVPEKLVPLNANGGVGQNTAAGLYGAWFDAKGNTADYNWGNVHVFIEGNDLYSWSFGCHPGNCAPGEKHVVAMQYQLGSKVVKVFVTFYIHPGEFNDDGSSDDAPVAEKKTINISAEMNFSGGYTQDGKIEVSKNEVETFLGGTPDKLVALNADGSVGQNTAAGRYGAWFDASGNTAEFNWGNVHAYIESNDLYSWAYGCHPHNCRKGDAHTVQMQYQRGSKTVDVMVTFTIK